MKKYLLIFTTLMMFTFSACGKEEPVIEEDRNTAVEEEHTPQLETWSTAPDFKGKLITTTPIRYLSATVGSTEEEVLLTWFSPSSETGQVLWTTAEDTEFENAYVYSTSVTPSESISGYYINRVTVDGLTENTDYLYQVGNEEGYSPAYSFSTSAFSDTFRFTAVGDAQLGKPVEHLDKQKNTWHKVLNKIKYHFPDSSFLASMGDQVNTYDDTEQYNAFLNQAALYSIPLAPVKGNHEIGGSQFSEHYSLPNQSTLGSCDDEGDGNYWFTRGNALFMVLNLMDSNKMDEHKEFIAAAVEANPEAKWRIIFSHYSPYNGYESYLENADFIRPYFLEFTDTYDIDLVLTGHDHSYIRTHFIQKDGSYNVYESPAVNPEGTLYLTLSSSSGSLYRRPTDQEETAVSKKRETPEVTDVQISSDSMILTTYNAETWEITDSFEIQK